MEVKSPVTTRLPSRTDSVPALTRERLPFRVRFVDSAQDLEKAVEIRSSAYARHVPSVGAALRKPETDDYRRDVLILLAERKIDGQPVGSVRLQTNVDQPLRIEGELKLPDVYSNRRLIEAMRRASQMAYRASWSTQRCSKRHTRSATHARSTTRSLRVVDRWLRSIVGCSSTTCFMAEPSPFHTPIICRTASSRCRFETSIAVGGRYHTVSIHSSQARSIRTSTSTTSGSSRRSASPDANRRQLPGGVR